jgi:hypothetical protein
MSGIPVKTHLDGETFKTLERIAKQQGTTVGELLAWGGRRIAGTATMPQAKRARRREFDESVVSEWVVAANMGVSNAVIAERYGVSQQLVSKRLLERGVRRHDTGSAA